MVVPGETGAEGTLATGSGRTTETSSEGPEGGYSRQWQLADNVKMSHMSICCQLVKICQ